MNDALLGRRVKARVGQECRNRRAEASGHILWRSQRLAGQRDDAMRQRHPIKYGALGGDRGPRIHANQSDIRRDPV